MVGGGNYIEYQNLMELAQSKGSGGISSPSGASVSLLSPGTPNMHFENLSKIGFLCLIISVSSQTNLTSVN
jgi:hypothetical protein